MALFGATWLSKATRHWPALAHQCLACHRWPSPDMLCPDCWQRFYQHPIRCSRCALALPGLDTERPCCGACLRQPPLWQCAVAWQDYSYPWQQLLQRWKFEAQPGLARHFARWMRTDERVQALLAQADALVAVPSSPQRLRAHGYHPAAQLAQHLATRQPHIHALVRSAQAGAQHQLGRAQRLKNLHQALALAPAQLAHVQGRRLLVIDDVMTTGATFSAATQCLLHAGAAQVSVLCLARTPADQRP